MPEKGIYGSTSNRIFINGNIFINNYDTATKAIQNIGNNSIINNNYIYN